MATESETDEIVTKTREFCERVPLALHHDRNLPANQPLHPIYGHGSCHWLSSRALSFLGMHDEAIARLKLAKQLDPVSPRAYAAAAAVYYAAGDYRESLEESRAALELDPHLPTALYFAGVCQFSIGETEKAIETLQTCARESHRHPASLSALITVLAHAGRRVEAEAIVEELRERATRGEVSPYHFAEAYLGLGDTERALEYLRRSHELNLPDMIGLFVDPLFRPLRGNAAFEGLLRNIRGAAG